MTQAKKGDKVKVHYTGSLNDGSVFDSSVGREPLEFTLGAGQVIPGFDSGVEGLKVGESKKINIPCAQAYGDFRPELTQTVDRKMLPADLTPEVGQQLQVPQDNGQSFIVTVSQVTPESVTLDANHPLAGKDLNFELQLTEICK